MSDHYWVLVIPHQERFIECGVFASDTAAKSAIESALGHAPDWQPFGTMGADWLVRGLDGPIPELLIQRRLYDTNAVDMWARLIEAVEARTRLDLLSSITQTTGQQIAKTFRQVI